MGTKRHRTRVLSPDSGLHNPQNKSLQTSRSPLSPTHHRANEKGIHSPVLTFLLILATQPNRLLAGRHFKAWLGDRPLLILPQSEPGLGVSWVLSTTRLGFSHLPVAQVITQHVPSRTRTIRTHLCHCQHLARSHPNAHRDGK